jgi:hypothetical protein
LQENEKSISKRKEIKTRNNSHFKSNRIKKPSTLIKFVIKLLEIQKGKNKTKGNFFFRSLSLSLTFKDNKVGMCQNKRKKKNKEEN